MKLQDILSQKGNLVYSVALETTLKQAVGKLVEHNIGALLVCQPNDAGEDMVLGIITERDLLHYCGSGKCALGECNVSDVMTSEVITASPDDPVEKIMGLMTTKRIRHLPVVDKGKLLGMVSIGDIVKAQHDQLAMENRFMKDYIQGEKT